MSNLSMQISMCHIYIVILFLYTILNHSTVLGYRPHFIGPEFSAERMQTLEDNLELARICGTQDDRARVKEFPWAISVLINGKNRLGGSIISPYHILTVAHGFLVFGGYDMSPCMIQRYRTKKELEDRVVAYGGKCIRGLSNVFPNDIHCQARDVTFNKIRSVMVDGDFSVYGCDQGHDWAIIELERPIVFNRKTRPICLPRYGEPLQRILTVSGWGRSYIFNESGPLIRETPMYLDETCHRPWADHLPNDAEDYLCATSMNMSDYYAPRTCHGDSGSGMEQRDHNGRAHLIAITSFGTKGCPANELARFTRVKHYLKPICEMTGVCYRNPKR